MSSDASTGRDIAAGREAVGTYDVGHTSVSASAPVIEPAVAQSHPDGVMPEGDSASPDGLSADSAPPLSGGGSIGQEPSQLVRTPITSPILKSNRLEIVVFALVIALSAALRFTGVNWDNGSQLHPDERFLFMVEGAIRPGIVTPGSNGAGDSTRDAPIWQYYFDSARSGLNPHNVGYGFFVYGTFPLFFAKLVLSAVQSFGFDRIHIVGRVLSALSDVGSVSITIFIARRLLGTRIALLTGVLMATCVLHIQQSHFFVFDSFLVTLVLSTFWFCLDVVALARWRDFARVGLMLGLTLATKLSMIVFLPVVALAGLIHLLSSSAITDSESSDGVSPPRFATGIPSLDIALSRLVATWNDGRFATVLAGGLLVGIVAFGTFRVAQPYAFAGPSVFDLRLNARWLDNIDYQAKSQSGEVDLPPSIQWANTLPVIFPLRHMVIWGLGVPLGLVSLSGLGVAAWTAVAKGRWQLGIIAFWALLCLLYFSSVLNKTMRYLLPAYPFVIILGAWAVVGFIEMARQAKSVRLSNSGLSDNNESDIEAPVRIAGWPGTALQSPALSQGMSWLGWVALATVVGWSAAWSFAFTRIYQLPVSRGAASMWIYKNVPPPAPMANEHWDDPLPLPIPGYDHSRYAGPQLPLYDPDEPKKIDTIVQMLSQSTYLNMTSNRLYGSIPRMPERYPMTTEYYRRLFAGELGYTHVATISSYPTLGPWTINDDLAEEAFTVYDHPKVLIYKKDADFSAQKVREILSAVPLDNVRNVPPIMAGSPTLALNETSRLAITNGGTWREAFSPEGTEQVFAPLLWFLVIQVFGIVVAPFLWRVMPSLPDRGYAFAKTFGLLAVSWVGWWLASVGAMEWTRLTLLVACGIVALGAGLTVRHYGREWVRWLRANSGTVLASEATFVIAFAFFCAVRALNPDLWHPARGGEKPMEFAYLNAVIRTASFPPYDPWYAGGYLNYYYWGYVLVAVVTKLTGVVPAIAFNLAVPMVFALTAAGAFGAASNLAVLGAHAARVVPSTKLAMVGGALGVLFTVVVGNLDAFGQLVVRMSRAASTLGASGLGNVASLVAGIPAVLVAGAPLEGFDFWRSSRVIPNNTINEFPFWTFLFSDLHAHMISLSLQVAMLGVLLAVVSSGVRIAKVTGEATLVGRIRMLLGLDTVGVGLGIGWILGSLRVINTWEFPTYVGLAAVAIAIREVSASRAITLIGATRASVTLAVAFASAPLLFRPFWSNYLTVYSSISVWTTDKTTIIDYAIIHGAMLLELAAFIAMFGWPAWRGSKPVRWGLMRVRRADQWARLDRLEGVLGKQSIPWGFSSIVAAFCATLAAVSWLGGLGLVGVLVFLTGAMVSTAWERRENGPIAFASAVGATGAAIGIFVEFFTLSGDIGRMNTVFKFYLQVWVLWSFVSAAVATWLGTSVFSNRRASPITPWQWAWATSFVALGLAVLAYPLGAVPARLADRFAPLPPTLDGMAYMRAATVFDASSEVTPANPGGVNLRAFADYAALNWLLTHVDGTPVVLEASVPEYRWGSRVSKYTGLPAVLGWRWHQAQQRGPYAPQVDARLRDVQAMFNAPNAGSIAPLLARYHVRYVYVGDLERAYYTAAGIAKFGSNPAKFRPVYDSDGVIIYEVAGNDQQSATRTPSTPLQQ
jgi:YYY domain-containing protein